MRLLSNGKVPREQIFPSYDDIILFCQVFPNRLTTTHFFLAGSDEQACPSQDKMLLQSITTTADAYRSINEREVDVRQYMRSSPSLHSERRSGDAFLC